jgi:hypothetical protein
MDEIHEGIRQKFCTATQQYNLDFLSSHQTIESDASKTAVLLPPKHMLLHDKIVFMLERFFECERETDARHEIVFQFHPKYLLHADMFQILYPLKNNVLYINENFDIIYASRSCMHMLYQILKSNYFQEYLEGKRIAKPGLFKIMTKRYFYDYISKTFVVKPYPNNTAPS